MTDVPRVSRSRIRGLMSIPRRIWRALGDFAEMLSEIGHGPRPWVDKGEFENPFEGAGPGEAGRIGRGRLRDS